MPDIEWTKLHNASPIPHTEVMVTVIIPGGHLCGPHGAYFNGEEFIMAALAVDPPTVKTSEEYGVLIYAWAPFPKFDLDKMEHNQ